MTLTRTTSARSAAVTCVALAAVLLAAACAGPLRITSPFRARPAPTVEQIAAPLRQTAKPVETLFLRARVVLWQRHRPGRVHFEAMILIEPANNRLRLSAFRDLPGALFDLLADSWGVRLRDARNQRYYAADSERLRRMGAPWAGLSPALLSQGLLVEQSVLASLESAESASVHRHWKSVELRLRTESARVRAYFDRDGRRILAACYEPVSGEEPTRLEYGEMTEVKGVRLPQWVEIDHGPTRTRLRLEVSQYKVNEPFKPAVWALQPPPGKQWLPLEMLESLDSPNESEP